MKSVMAGIALMIVISAAAWVITATRSQQSSVANISQNNTVRLDN